MTRDEKLKLLLDTGEYDFIKYIPKENMWKLIFALAYIEDTIPMSDIDSIKAEIKTEISDYEGYADFNEGVRFGLRMALEIIDKHISELKGETDKEYEAKVITRGNCMMCGKELTEGLFICEECENKAKADKERKE